MQPLGPRSRPPGRVRIYERLGPRTRDFCQKVLIVARSDAVAPDHQVKAGLAVPVGVRRQVNLEQARFHVINIGLVAVLPVHGARRLQVRRAIVIDRPNLVGARPRVP